MSSFGARSSSLKGDSVRKEEKSSKGRKPIQSTRKNNQASTTASNPKPLIKSGVAQTPKINLSENKKTPASTPVCGPSSMSVSDLDISSILLDGSNTSLNSTVMAPPTATLSSRLSLSGSASQGKKERKPTRPELKQSSLSSSSRSLGSNLEESSVTEEMMEHAYTRYIQAVYIEKKSREAKDAGVKQLNDQLFTLFNATEKLRQESLKIEQETLYWDLMGVVGNSLQLIKEKIRPALDVMGMVDCALKRTALGLESSEDFLPVKGIALGDREEAAREMEKVRELLGKFNEDFKARQGEVEAWNPELTRLREAYCKIASDYSRCLSLLSECEAKVELIDGLATHEVSLLCSLKQLKEAEVQEAGGAA